MSLLGANDNVDAMDELINDEILDDIVHCDGDNSAELSNHEISYKLIRVYIDFQKYSFLRPMRKRLAILFKKFRGRKVVPNLIVIPRQTISSNLNLVSSDKLPEIPLETELLVDNTSTNRLYDSSFHVHDDVTVEARMFPGVNKLGGVGKVIKVNFREQGIFLFSAGIKFTYSETTEEDYVYSVKYTVESGTEHNIEEKYIKHHSFSNDDKRSFKIRGRCV